MKTTSYTILLIWILIPPLCYIGTVQLAETYLQKRFTDQIAQVYIGDTKPLFDGTIHLGDAIAGNVDRFLMDSPLPQLGIRVNVTVRSGNGTILYPAGYLPDTPAVGPPDAKKVAEENYALMAAGLDLQIQVVIRHNSIFTNGILLIFICLAASGLYLYHRTSSARISTHTMSMDREIERLNRIEKEHYEKLDLLAAEREHLQEEMAGIQQRLEQEKDRASRNEDELIGDIVSLEEKLQKNQSLQDDRDAKMNALREKIEAYESRTSRKGRSATSLQKRFGTLYKNLSFHEKAVDSFAQLPENFQIKAEEIVHRLNANAADVPVKRKVFGKKGGQTVFEVVFGYKGRLYYRKTSGERIEVLTIGDKNSQAQDLHFLDRF